MVLTRAIHGSVVGVAALVNDGRGDRRGNVENVSYDRCGVETPAFGRGGNGVFVVGGGGYVVGVSRYRLFPTAVQVVMLVEHCRQARYVWNLAVERQQHW